MSFADGVHRPDVDEEGQDAPDVQPNECHGCGHTLAFCGCSTPDVDASEDAA